MLFIFFLISFIGQILKVNQTRYWIENNHFILTTGIFNKERKELDISRIQSVDTSQSMINQIVGGVQLQIKTPSDGIELSTISKSQSIELEHTIKNIQTQLDNSQIEIESNDFHNTKENNELHKKESFNEVPKNVVYLSYQSEI